MLFRGGHVDAVLERRRRFLVVLLGGGTAGGLWRSGGSGQPSAAPRWPTTAETAGGLRPRHWPPPATERGAPGGPYWIRLESALTMSKPDDEEASDPAAAEAQKDHQEATSAFEYRVDVPASEQHRRTTSSSGDQQQQQQEQEMSFSHPLTPQLYPSVMPTGESPLHHYVNTGYQFPTGGGAGGFADSPPTSQRRAGAAGDQSQLGGRAPWNGPIAGGGGGGGFKAGTGGCTGPRYPGGGDSAPRDGGLPADDVGGPTGDGVDELAVQRGRRRPSREPSPRRHRHRRHHHHHPHRHQQRHVGDDDVTMTSPSPGVDPPRYELFTHV